MVYSGKYQSDKYTNRTAESEPIVVTLGASFDVKQESITKFKLTFTKETNLAYDSVLVERRDGDIWYYEPSKPLTAASKATDATVELYNDAKNNTEYRFTVKGYEESVSIPASVGKPVDFKVVNNDKPKGSPNFVVAEKDQELTCIVYDAKGVDISKNYQEHWFEFKPTGDVSPEDYTLGDKFIRFEKIGTVADITVVLHLPDENGEENDNLTRYFQFASVDSDKVNVKEKSATIKKGDKNYGTRVPLNTEGAKLEVKFKLTNSNQEYTTASETELGRITFKVTNPDYFSIDEDGTLHLFQEGTATVVISLEKADGTSSVIDAVPVTVDKKAELKSISLDKNSVVVSTVKKLGEATITVKGKNNYGEDCSPAGQFGVTPYNKDAKESGFMPEIEGDKIKIAGFDFAEALGEKESKVFSYKVKATNANEVSLTITVRKPNPNGTVTYAIEQEPGTTNWGEIARTAKDSGTKAEKSITLNIYELKGGVKNSELNEIALWTNNTKADGTDGRFFVKVTKDGKPVTDTSMIVVSGSAVTIRFSGIKAAEGTTAVSGSAIVDTSVTGAGNYVVTLLEAANGKFTTRRSVNGRTTYNPGSYSFVGLSGKESVASSSKQDLFEYFKFKNAQGNDAQYNDATVDVDITDGNAYVFVKSFTFYDEVGTNAEGEKVYVPYTVNVNKSVKVAQ